MRVHRAQRHRATAQRHVPEPAGPGEHLADLEQLRAQAGRGHAVSGIAMTRPGHGQIDGEHQRPAAGRPGPVDDRLDDAAVANHVELEPERARGGFGQFVEPAEADRRERERHAGGFGRAQRLDLAAARGHAAQADRRQGQRHGAVLAGQARGGVDGIDVDQHALAKPDLIPVARIGRQRAFAARAAGIVVVQKSRQAPAGALAIILGCGWKPSNHDCCASAPGVD